MFKNISARKRKILTYVLFGLIIILLFMKPADNRHQVPAALLEEVETDISTLIDSSVTAVQFRIIRDSLEKIKAWKKNRLIAPGEGLSVPIFLGVRKLTECDSCGEIMPSEKNSALFRRKYFIEFSGYTLSNTAAFFIEKDKYFIKNYISDKTRLNSVSAFGTPKQIAVRFSSPLNQYQKPHTSLLLPVSKTVYTIVDIVLWIYVVIWLLLSLWAFIAFIAILFAIANGQAFTLNNIMNLKIVGWLTIIPIIIPLLSALITKLLMNKKIPEEIYFPIWLYIHDNLGWLIVGLIALLLADAFKSGYNLQKEVELTV